MARGSGECLKAADELGAHGLWTRPSPMHASPSRWIWNCCSGSAREHEVLLTIEEGSIGGFGSFVMQTLAEHGVLDERAENPLPGAARRVHRPGSPNAMYAQAGLDAKGIVSKTFEGPDRVRAAMW